jgi:uncharacterized membrane protein YgdD (TMEM256/DUF423 family)
MNKRINIAASVFGLSAVILGAFGAHGLKAYINPSGLEIWKTAVDYQFYHTLALLFLAVLPQNKNRLINAASWSFIFGIILFSGSLYLLAIRELFNLNPAVLGPVTPIGGLLFISGWISLLLAALKYK